MQTNQAELMQIMRDYCANRPKLVRSRTVAPKGEVITGTRDKVVAEAHIAVPVAGENCDRRFVIINMMTGGYLGDELDGKVIIKLRPNTSVHDFESGIDRARRFTETEARSYCCVATDHGYTQV